MKEVDELMKFIHIADVHLGIEPDKGKAWSEDRSREIKETFQKVIQEAEEKQVDLLLIAGDLFHMPPSEGMLREVDYMFSKLTKTKTIIVAGSHDYMKEGSPYESYRFSSKTICLAPGKVNNVYMRDLNTCVTGFSYGSKEITDHLIDKLKPAQQGANNILLAHAGDAKHVPYSKKALKGAGFDYVALGHIHKPEIISENKVINVGSLEPLGYTETGARGYVFGEAENGLVQARFIPINQRSYMNLLINIKPEHTQQLILDLVEQEIKRLGTKNIFRILLKGQNNDKEQFDFTRLIDTYYIYEVVEAVTEEYDLSKLYDENKDNLVGKYIKKLSDDYYGDEVSRQALHYGLEALLETGEK